MKAITYRKYGSPDVLTLEEIEKPAPKENEVLIKVRAASVNAADIHLLRGDPWVARFSFGLTKPKRLILGLDVAGQVEAVGSNVQQFKPGDEVFGDISFSGSGAFAEYACGPEHLLAAMPTGVTFEQAAALPVAGYTALQAFRDHGQVQPGQKVLIYGASGGVGTFAIQMAKYYGADVTAVCSNRNIEQALSLGADHIVDYTKQDFTRSSERYDLILGCNGYHSLSHYRRALKPAGAYWMAGGTTKQIFEALLLGTVASKMWGQQMAVVSAKPNKNDLEFLGELLQSGRLKAIICGTYPLQHGIEAIRCVDEGHAQAKVVITIS